MQNVPNECELRLELPALREVSIHFLGECDEAVNEMLARATQLERFDSYKLWVRALHFLAPHPTLAVTLTLTLALTLTLTLTLTRIPDPNQNP